MAASEELIDEVQRKVLDALRPFGRKQRQRVMIAIYVIFDLPMPKELHDKIRVED